MSATDFLNLIRDDPLEEMNYNINNAIFIFNIPIKTFVEEVKFNINTPYRWYESKEPTTLIKVAIENKRADLIKELVELGAEVENYHQLIEDIENEEYPDEEYSDEEYSDDTNDY